MNFLTVFRLAFVSLGRNKTRSFLTALGIIIGVGSVITMVGVGLGAYASVQDQISKMGTNLIMVIPGASNQRGAMGGMGTITTLNEDDVLALEAECSNLARVCPVVRTGSQLVYSSQNWSSSIWGVGPTFLEVRNWKMGNGSFFGEREMRSGAKVCILGATVARELFGEMNPVGKTIRIKKMPFEVLGVLEARGQSGMGQDQDDLVVAPLMTVQRRMLGITNLHMIMASAVSDDLVTKATEEIKQLLRRRHKLQDKDADDFDVRTQADMAAMAGSTLGIVTLLLGSIASVSLLVGGIGIMNIMLVSVTERTREIGIRMAIGAKGRDIMTQFLVEAVALSSIGGALGISVGIGLTHVVTYFTEWPSLVSLPAVAGSFLFSAMVGIFFGLYPAWKASQLDPIEALRFE